MCDLLTDPHIAELRAMHDYIESTLARLDTLNPLAASSVPSLSPDAGKDGAVGGTLGDVA
jgi:hypothetical protein